MGEGRGGVLGKIRFGVRITGPVILSRKLAGLLLKSNGSNGEYIDLQSIVSIDSMLPAILIQRA